MDTGYLNCTENGLIDYTHLSVEVPPLFIPYNFEVYDYKASFEFINRNRWISFVAGGLYLLMISVLQNYMKTRQAYDLKKTLALWNGALGVFSIIGFLRFAPEFLYQFGQPSGIWKSFCVRQGANYPAMFWGYIFVLSKFVELGDTAFLILRKKPVSFLQWCHHLATVMIAWLTAPFLEPVMRYCVIMNYGVHSLMYPYFAITVFRTGLFALGVKIPRGLANIITTLQLSQMVIGFVLHCLTAYLYYAGTGCERHPTSVLLWGLTYGVMIFLFGRLFNDSVLKKPQKKVE